MAQFPTINEQKGKHDHSADEVLKGLLINGSFDKKNRQGHNYDQGSNGHAKHAWLQIDHFF